MQVLTLCCKESQVKIHEEQWKSDLSATPTCDMPWRRPHLPRFALGLGLAFFIVLYAPVPEDQRKPSENRPRAVQVGIFSNSNM